MKYNCLPGVSEQRRRLREGHAVAAVVESTELRGWLLRREEQQRQRSAVVSAALRHDRRLVNATDRFRATTVSLPQSRDQGARVTSSQRFVGPIASAIGIMPVVEPQDCGSVIGAHW